MTNTIITIPTAANDNSASDDADGIIRLLATSLQGQKAPTGEAIAEAIDVFNKSASQFNDTQPPASIAPIKSRPDVTFSVPKPVLDLFEALYPNARFRTSKEDYLVADIPNSNGGVFPMSFARFCADIFLRTNGLALPNGVRLTYRNQTAGPRDPLMSNLRMVSGGGDSFLTRWNNDITLKAVAEGGCPVKALEDKRTELEPTQIARLLECVRSGLYRVEADVPPAKALKRLYSKLAKALGASRHAVPGWRKKAIADGLITAEEWQTCLGLSDTPSSSIAA